MNFDQLSEEWFPTYHLGPSFDVFEAEEAPDDRAETASVLARMRDEFPRTLARLFGVEPLAPSFESLVTVERYIGPHLLRALLDISSPKDPNSELRLCLSEFAVFLGDSMVTELGARWRPARRPNFHLSTVVAEAIELSPFTVIFHCVTDDHESIGLVTRIQRYIDEVRSRRLAGPLSIRPAN